MARGNVFTIAPGLPFVDALAAGLTARCSGEPLALARVRVLLPNRRACRALALAFLRRTDGRPQLLPRMMPIGDLEEDALAFAEVEGGAGALELPPAISPLRRLLLLARLIKELRAERHLPALADDLALRLARELARLIDQIHIERLDDGALATLVPEELARHWQLTLDFLTTLLGRWRTVLAARQALDPADRRNRLLAAQAAAWAQRPPAEPVIAAGSTGSMPATADLIATVAALPAGAVVLPGVDTEADDATWQAFLEDPGHPQFGMARLLARLGVDRRDIRPWPAPGIAGTAPERARLLHAALRPAAVAHLAAARAQLGERAVAGMARLEAPGLAEEARAIALILRETLEQPERTAALVTADRGLARRVAAELARWGIEVDDTAGEPLAATPPAVLLRLLAGAASGDRPSPPAMLKILKHPLAALGLAPGECRRRARGLELKLRRERAAASDETATDALAASLEAALAPLAALHRARGASLGAWLQALIAAGEQVAASDREPGAARLWAGDAGEALADVLADLADAAAEATPVAAADFPTVLEELLADRVVRPRYGRDPRLQIWGPLEARLQSADRLILGGLNEGSWPPEAPASPWMSRPMMRAFGLPLPERRIGLSAHDFVQAACAREVWLTRALRVAGAPTVASRWLLRLDALLAGPLAEAMAAAGRRWLDWQEALDRAERLSPQPMPEPRPPLAARPRDLPVTDIETWVRDPYALYAKRILGLAALAPLARELDAADYGRFIHQALDDFVRETPGPLGNDALDRLLACGRRRLGNLADEAAVRTFWWPRFERIARWFLAAERQRRADVVRSATEVSGAIVLETMTAPFTVRARADRIDVLADGSLVIIDYKTGAPPTRKQVGAGFAPQLPLEALIALEGGFADLPPANIAALEFWRLKAADGEVKRLVGGRPPLPPPAELAARAKEQLRQLIATFDDPATPYLPRPRPSYAPAFSDYEHLARIKEWSVGADGEEER